MCTMCTGSKSQARRPVAPTWEATAAHLRAGLFGELEELFGEKVNMDGVRPSTMTCLALETLPLPVYDIMAM